MSAYLIRHRLPGLDAKGCPRFALYLSDARPERRHGVVSFVGRAVTLDRPHPHAAASGYRWAEHGARWRELDGFVTVEQPPAHMRLPTDGLAVAA